MQTRYYQLDGGHGMLEKHWIKFKGFVKVLSNFCWEFNA